MGLILSSICLSFVVLQVRAEDYETMELLVNDAIDHCVDDYSRAENLYSWLVSQEIPSTNGFANDGESPLFALSCIAKGERSYADVFLEMARSVVFSLLIVILQTICRISTKNVPLQRQRITFSSTKVKMMSLICLGTCSLLSLFLCIVQ